MSKVRISYSEPVAGELCRRVREGQSLAAICRDPAMPFRTTIRKWTARHPAFAAELKRARYERADARRPDHPYSTELADAFCARVAAGERLLSIFADPAMPSCGTIYVWLERRAEFAAKYERARAVQTEAELGPFVYSLAVADAFCARIAAGEPLRKVCARPGMPSIGTVYVWIARRPEFAARYEQARELRRAGGESYVTWSEAVADEVCERIAAGESLREVAADPTLPSYDTIQAWRRTRPEFASRFDEARRLAAEMVEDEMLYVINTVTPATASAGRVKLAGLTALAAKHAKAAGDAKTWRPMEIRFVEPAPRDEEDDYG